MVAYSHKLYSPLLSREAYYRPVFSKKDERYHRLRYMGNIEVPVTTPPTIELTIIGREAKGEAAIVLHDDAILISKCSFFSLARAI